MNPFQPPAPLTDATDDLDLVADVLTEPDEPPHSFKRAAIMWTVILMLNIITPVMFASAVVGRLVGLGIISGILVFLFGGWLMHYRYPRWGRSLNAGGFFIAVTQFVPILQIIAGAIGIEVTRVLGATDDVGDDAPMGVILSDVGGFVCTIVTGTVLIMLALILGWIVTAVRQAIRRGKRPATPV